METPIRDVLARKGSTVHTVGLDASVFEAITQMEEVRVGSLVVVDGDEVAGMLTERDYLRRVALQGRSSRTTAVREIMSAPVVCASLDESVQYALAVMTEKRCRHLPVVGERGGLAGLVSIGDLVKQIVREQKGEIRFLHDYISGKYPG